MRRATFIALIATALTFIGVLGVSVFLPPNLAKYHDGSQTVLAEDGSILRAFLSKDGMWRIPMRYKDVEPRYADFLIAYEDKRFWSHLGVDPLAILRATGQLISSGRIISGASTITMQVVRLLEPRPRTLLSKLIEMARAVQLELTFSKEEILSMYFSLAPFGGNVEGATAASLIYFNKVPARLTVSEAALLVALPQSPTVSRPDRNPQKAMLARNKVLERLLAEGLISERELNEAKDEIIDGYRHPFPFIAPHLARRLVSQYPERDVIHTHINPEFQNSSREILKMAVDAEGGEINGAVIIVENKTGAVLSYAASSDFFDRKRRGQVDYIRAIRSPGSALKPFIYAMAFDENIAHPETLLADEETRFGGYRPTNFDGRDTGEVSASDALKTSLNTPAVTLLHKIGPRRFLSQLGTPKYKPIIVDADPGLSIALGGLGISLEHLVSMYTAFGNGGNYRDISLTKYLNFTERSELFNQLSSDYIIDILKKTPRPAGRYNGLEDRDIAFKTGTSSSYRDVLAVGFDETFTVGVWLGHPEAKPMRQKTGIKTAAPLLFRIFDMLPHNKAEKGWLRSATIKEAPKNLRRVVLEKNENTSQNQDSFGVAFPVEGAKIPFISTSDGTATSLSIKLKDGSRPFSVFVNGRAMHGRTVSRSIAWTPKGAGFYSIVAVDRAGNVAETRFELASPDAVLGNR